MKLIPLFLLAVSAFAQTPLNFSFTWTDSVSTGVTGYKLYGAPTACLAGGGAPAGMVLKSPTLITAKPYKIPAVSGTWCFAMTAMKSGTNPDGTSYISESAYSVGVTIAYDVSQAPTGLTGTIVP